MSISRLIRGRAVLHCLGDLTVDVLYSSYVYTLPMCAWHGDVQVRNVAPWALRITRLAIKCAPAFRFCVTLHERLTLMKATLSRCYKCDWRYENLSLVFRVSILCVNLLLLQHHCVSTIFLKGKNVHVKPAQPSFGVMDGSTWAQFFFFWISRALEQGM